MPRDKSIVSDLEEDDVPSSVLSNALMIPDTFDFDIRTHSGAASDDPYPAMARPQIRRSHRRSSMVVEDSKRSPGASLAVDANAANAVGSGVSISPNSTPLGLPKSNSNSSIGGIIATAQLPSSPYLYSNTTSVSGNAATSKSLHASSSFNNLSLHSRLDSSPFMHNSGDSPVSYHTANSNIPSSPSFHPGAHSDSAIFSSPPVTTTTYPERHSSHSWKSSPSISISVTPNSFQSSSRQPYTPRSVSGGHHPANPASDLPSFIQSNGNTGPAITPYTPTSVSTNSGHAPLYPPLSSPSAASIGNPAVSNVSLTSSPLIATPLKYTRHTSSDSASYSASSVYSPSPPAAPLTTYANATIDNNSNNVPLPNLLSNSHSSSNRFNKSNPVDLTIQTPTSKQPQRSQPIVISPASVSWRANEPNEWTNERVIQWLEVNKFGPDWIQIFKSRNIHGSQFLSLVNYQNLKKLGPFSTKNEDHDTSPSRFIHILRKLLNKSSSTNSTNSNEGANNSIVGDSGIATPSIPVPSPKDYPRRSSEDISSIIAPRNSTSIDDSSTSSKYTVDPESSTASPLERIISNPIEHKASYDNFMDFRHNMLARPRNSQPKQRPMSTFESSSKSTFHQPPISPSFRPGFLRRHNKSNSSESSLLIPQSNSVTSLLEQDDAGSTKDLKVNILDQPEPRKNRGIFKKFRIRDRSKSRDNLRLDSPTSPSLEISIPPQIHQKQKSPSTTTEKYLFLDPKYRPQKEQQGSSNNSLQHILVTRDNKTFTLVSIVDLASISEVKSAIANQLNLGISIMDVHLTEFGCSKGEMLEESILQDILFGSFPQQWSPECIKLFVSSTAPPSSSLLSISGKSTSSLSLNAISSHSDTNNQKYPNTPAYMIQNGNDAANNSDYFDSNRLQVPDHDNTNTNTNPKTNVQIHVSSDSMDSSLPLLAPPDSGRRTSDDSFKVIRPARREINFDDRRSSPYDRKASANLVALREAPPPPISRSQSIKSVTSLKRQGTLDKKRSIKGRKEVSPSRSIKETKVTINTKDVPSNNNGSLKTYSPGQSENLIPMPYVGNTQQNAVVRRPVRRGSDTSSRYSNSSNLLTINTSQSSPNVATDESVVPIFKMPEFSKSSPLGPPMDKSMGPGERFGDGKFQENEISFEGAPAFVDDDDDDDDSSSDDGFWAKKPPKLSEPSKPLLHVETTAPIGNATIFSPTTPYKSTTSSTASPVRIVDENGESWAVRPPAEVVYENLERFFPNADLDRPIIDDVPLSPIDGGATITKSTVLPTVIEPKESPVQQQQLKPWRIQPIKQRVDRNTPTLRPSVSHSSKSDTSKLRAPSRMKSLRIVAREASEARKRFSSAAASSNQTGGALLRRKSTKMWGQKVVEMTPNEIRDGNLSTLRDQKGEFKQFVWVKGELIGKGTFGKVYLALNATTGEMMAVKQVEVPQTIGDKESDRQREVVGALHSEVETLKDLDHLNIVQYLGFEALSDVYNLFLEYVPGGSVGRCLRMYGRFEEPIIKSLTHQVLDGLSYLHSRGILHRVSTRIWRYECFLT